MIHTTGRDLPRAVNNLALQSLIVAYTAEKSLVDEASARIAVNEYLATD